MEKVVLLFPGQGSQYTGMGKKIYNESHVARQIFEQASDVLGYSLKKLCFDADFKELSKPENFHPAILTVSVAMFRASMEQTGILPTYSAGHSFGEFSALTCAEAIRFQDAIVMVRQRGIIMKELAASAIGTMCAVGYIDKRMVEEECQKLSTPDNMVVVSNYNSPNQLVISGHMGAVEKVGKLLGEAGAKIKPLNADAPFHSPLMECISEKLGNEMMKYQYNMPRWAVISNVIALPYTSASSIPEYLTKQMTSAVQWEASMQYLKSQGVTLAIEIGPQKALKNLAIDNIPTIKAFSYDMEEDKAELLRYLSGKEEVAQKAIDPRLAIIAKCLELSVCTPNFNWNNEEYYEGVVNPYKDIQRIYEQLELPGEAPSAEQIQQAFEMVKSVLSTKKIPEDERAEIFSEIIES